MMQRYRFFGSFTEIGDRTFSRVGQSADWDETVFRDIIRGASFVPEADFKKANFTQDELDRYADYANRALAPESFNVKIKQCALIAHELREKLSTREVSEEIASVPEESPAAYESGN
jgi:hypothetical protein